MANPQKILSALISYPNEKSHLSHEAIAQNQNLLCAIASSIDHHALHNILLPQPELLGEV